MAVVSTSQNLTAVSYIAGEAIDITSGAVLTVDSSNAVFPGIITCLTAGKLLLTNSSPTNPIVFTVNAITSDMRFEGAGIIEATGAMIQLGTGTGAASQSFSLASAPLNVIPYPSYVEVETGNGTDNYHPWPVVPTVGTTVVFPITQFAGGNTPAGRLVFWNATARTISCGTGTNGNVFPSGARVRIPNIYIHANANTATPASRALLDLSPTGTANLSCVGFSDSVYFSMANHGPVTFNRVGFIGGYSLASTAADCTLDHFAISPDPSQSATAVAFNVTSVYGELKLNKVSTLIGGLVTGASKNVINQAINVTQFDDCTFNRVVIDPTATNEAAAITYLQGPLTVRNLNIIGGRAELTNSANLVFVNPGHAQTPGTTQSTLVAYAYVFVNCQNIKFVGFVNAGPSAARGPLFNTDGQCSNIEIYNISYDGANNTGGLHSGAAAGTRFYNGSLTNLRTATILVDSPAAFLMSGTGVHNLRATMVGTNSTDPGPGFVYDMAPTTVNSVLTAVPGVYNYVGGSFTVPGASPTTGSVVFGPFCVGNGLAVTGTAYADNNGGIRLPAINDSFTAEIPFVLHGVTSFQNVASTHTYTRSSSALVDTTTAPTSMTIEFRVKRPTGAYGSYTALTGPNLSTALSSLVGYTYQEGFMMQVRYTTTIVDSTCIVNQIILPTNVNSAYVAADSTVNLLGPAPTDVVELRTLVGDTLVATFTGGGEHEFSAAPFFGQQVYWIRKDASLVQLMSTHSSPVELGIGTLGNTELFFGSEVQVAQSTAIANIEAIVSAYLDVAISSRASALDLAAVATYVSTANTGITALSADLAAVQTDVDTANTSLAALTTAVATANTGIVVLGTDLTAVQADVDTANTSLTALTTSVGTANTSLTSLTTAVATANTNITGLDTDLAAVQADVDTANTSLASLTASVGTANTGISGLTTAVATANSGIVGLDTDLAAIQADVDTTNTSLTALTTSVATANTSLAGLTTSVGTANTGISGLTTSVATANTSLTSLTTAVSGLDADLASVQADVDTANTSLVALTASVGTANTSLTALTTAVGGIDSDLTAVQADVDTANTSLTSLTTSVATANTSLTGLTTSLGTANTGISSIITSVAGIDTDLVAVQTDVGTANTSLTALTTSVGTVGTNVLATQASVGTANLSLTALTSAVANVDSDVAAVATTLTSVQTAVNGTGTAVTSLSSAVANVDSDVAALKVVADAIKVDTLDIGTDVNALALGVSLVQTTIEAVDDNVDAVKVNTNLIPGLV